MAGRDAVFDGAVGFEGRQDILQGANRAERGGIGRSRSKNGALGIEEILEGGEKRRSESQRLVLNVRLQSPASKGVIEKGIDDGLGRPSFRDSPKAFRLLYEVAHEDSVSSAD